ncbi:Protein phosphatase 1G [Holothuria leucospilota]|uniref:protein-serine/threonine phosphatase n=1 Tax=Holothuria leucospilota TaxID=206669 RepID=A0A9Q1BUG0_HOLLE|nr:Protein phosphatase 1G [Holothuria leucospilota]
MGAYLSQPNLEKVSENGGNDRLKYGASAMQGWRFAQEDDHNCLPNFDEKTELFGVYDGHGGPEVAIYCAKHLPDFIKKCPGFKNGDMEKALEEAFMMFDAHLKDEKVIQQLKEIAGINNCSDAEEEEVENLQEEANLPLGELLTRFGVASKKNQRSLRKKANREDLLSPVVTKKKPVFPLLNDKKITNGSGVKGEEKINSGSENKTVETVTKEDKGSELVKNENGTSSNGTTSNGTSKTHSTDEENVKEETDSNELEDSEKVVCNGKNEIPETEKTHKSSKEADEEEVEEEDDDEDYEGGEVEDEDGDGADGEDDEEEEDEEEEEEEEEEEFDEEEDDDDNVTPVHGNEEPGSDSGTTACVAVVRGNEVIVANIGDSRCVLSREGVAVDLSVDHKPEDEEEMKRIVAAGGRVTMDGRVNGGLNLSRAFGDHCYKTTTSLPPEEQMICAFPDLQRATLSEKDEFMVIACDGIWNAMSSQEVVDFVKERVDADQKVKLSDICEELFDVCLAPDTTGDGTGCDNMTCIIVVFNHDQQKISAKRKEGGETQGAPQSKRPKV